MLIAAWAIAMRLHPAIEIMGTIPIMLPFWILNDMGVNGSGRATNGFFVPSGSGWLVGLFIYWLAVFAGLIISKRSADASATVPEVTQALKNTEAILEAVRDFREGRPMSQRCSICKGPIRLAAAPSAMGQSVDLRVSCACKQCNGHLSVAHGA